MKRTLKRWHWRYSDGTITYQGYDEKKAWPPPRAPYAESPVLVTQTFDDGKPARRKSKLKPIRKHTP